MKLIDANDCLGEDKAIYERDEFVIPPVIIGWPIYTDCQAFIDGIQRLPSSEGDLPEWLRQKMVELVREGERENNNRIRFV